MGTFSSKADVYCGYLTNEKDQVNPTSCSCVSNAEFEWRSTTQCLCNNGYLKVDNECKKLYVCEDYTNQQGNSQNVEPCTCVTNANYVSGSTTKCVCDQGYFGNDGACKEYVTCGDLTNEKGSNNAKSCTCVTNANWDGDSTTQCKCNEGLAAAGNECKPIVDCEDFD